MNEYTDQTTTERKSKDFKNLFIGLLIAGIIILTGFFIFDHNKSGETIQTQQTEVAKVTTEKSEIQTNFDASLARLDSMQTANTSLDGKLTASKDEISKMKKEIRSILNKRNATASELAKARNMIAQLNGKITDMESQIAMLTQQNDTLRQNVVVLTTEKATLRHNLDSTTVVKEELAKKVDIASTLNASNITITPIKVRNNGKEKVSSVAKRVDKLVVSFDVNNRIIQPGTTDVYVVVTGPDGKSVASNTTDAAGDTFTTREDGSKTFTAKLPVDLQTSKTKNVEFAFAPGSHFQQGSYKIQIYQNGFLIGEKTSELRKGGLFS
jgi:flagellar basal body-associated protein FliL/archaellum component FlaF (FlaF/FlaG flagellin family)